MRVSEGRVMRLVAMDEPRRDNWLCQFTVTELNAMLAEFGRAPLRGPAEARRALVEEARRRAEQLGRPVPLGGLEL